MDSDIFSLVRSNVSGLLPNELLIQSVDVLQGVSQDVVSALEKIGIKTVFDLAASSIFFTAMRLTEAGLPDSQFSKIGRVPRDMVDDTSVSLEDIPNKDIDFLSALDTNTAQNLKQSMAVNSIRDLAL